MKILSSFHQRRIPCSIDTASSLINTFFQSDSLLWPSDLWPRDEFNHHEEPKIGIEGGHGGTRYILSEYVLGRRIKFEFISPKTLIGFHQFDIIPIDDNNVDLSHITRIEVSLSRYVLWQTMTRWVHDALIIDSFDQAESLLTGKHVKTKWHWYVHIVRHTLGGARLLMQLI